MSIDKITKRILLESEVSRQIFCAMKSCQRVLETDNSVYVEGALPAPASEVDANNGDTKVLYFNKVVCTTCYDKFKDHFAKYLAGLDLIDGREVKEVV